MNEYIRTSSCEVCGSQHLESVLNLGNHPMCDDLVELSDDRICNEYPIEILYCKTCNTAHQRYQVPKKELFPNSYHYRSRFTADVLNGMKSLVDSCSQRLGSLSGKSVLDVGCNDGSLLDFFKSVGCKTIGVEPTNACSDAAKKGHITFNDFFNSSLAHTIKENQGYPDLITFTNVFAHIEDLPGLLDALKKISNPSTVIVIENHYLGAVLEKNQFDTFYHEHPRTYSFTSFFQIAKTLGMTVLGAEFPSRYGGNIRVFLGHKDLYDVEFNFDVSNQLKKEKSYFTDFSRIRDNLMAWKINKKQEILNLVDVHGPLFAKAFPGRAAILIKLLELNETHISEVFERPGSMKIGHYIPGTRIPISSDDSLFDIKNKDTVILNLAWHISDEINQYLSTKGFSNVIDILDSASFKK